MDEADTSGIPFETLHRRKDGSLFPVEIDSRGTVLGGRRGLLSIVRDISGDVETRQRIQELAETASRRAAQLRSILDNMADGVLVTDASGTIVMANQATLRFLGVASENELRMPLTDLAGVIRPRDLGGNPLTASSLPFARALTGEIVEPMDYLISGPHSGPDVHTRINASPVRGLSGEIIGAVALIRDVTELTGLDRIKDQFIAVAAHELKTPVAVMKGYSQLLLRAAGELGPNRRKQLETIDRGADRITRIIDDLLAVSRFQLGLMEFRGRSVRLDTLLRDAVRSLSKTTPTHRLVVDRLEPVVVQGDPTRLGKVILSLLDNAVRYSPTESDVRVGMVVGDDTATVSVADSGVGIPSDKQSRVFGLFYRAHTGTPWDYGGMGVGLYIARETMAMHNGRIWFESTEGRGSTFHFSLPVEGRG